MNFDQTLSALRQYAVKKGINYSLDRLTPILERCGNPQNHCSPIIHVAGTNGKGSVVAFVKSILKEVGYSVGTFTSPHLRCYTERITINDKSIEKDDFVQLFQQLRQYHEDGLTEFETLTLMALLYFVEKKPDICILEVGLGGRLDATNICKPAVTVITSIAKDHEQFLGHTLPEIAAEKAGIIKSGVPVITSNTQIPDVLNVIQSRAKEKASPYIAIPPLDHLPPRMNLQGDFQRINASLAMKAVEIVTGIEDEIVMKKGCVNAHHWGRMTVISRKKGLLIIDAAHNPEGLRQLKKFCEKKTVPIEKTVVFSLHKAKPIKDMISIIKTLGNDFFFCQFDDEFSATFDDVKKEFGDSLKQYCLGSMLPNTDCVIITGSIYFIGPMKQCLTSNV